MSQVLIVGRPNVGKSTLINRVVGRRESITSEVSGVTRDIRSFPVRWKGKSFFLCDSGGLIFDKRSEHIQKKIETMVLNTLESVQKILFLVDYTDGVHPLDLEIATLLRPYSTKVVLVVNKADNAARREDLGAFFKLGFSDPVPVSALQGDGVDGILDMLAKELGAKTDIMDTVKETYRISFVGRPNVGKSSLINAILNEERVIVDDQWGTTRDSVEVFFESQGHKFMFVDTAGLRRRPKIKDSLEYYSTLRTDKSILSSDLVVLLLDAQDLLTDQDKKIVDFILSHFRNMVVFVNKWDLLTRTDSVRKDCLRIIHGAVPALEYFPFLFGSATERLAFGKLFDLIPTIIKKSYERLSTSDMNTFVEQVIMATPPPSKSGRRLKVYYATQADVNPPTFVFFVNDTSLIDAGYQRFVERKIRDSLGDFTGVSIKLSFRSRSRLPRDSKPAPK